jgi:cell division protein FtsN
MPRDYKDAANNKRGSGGLFSGAMPFMTGLSIGLLVAFVVFLVQSDQAYIPFWSKPAGVNDRPAPAADRPAPPAEPPADEMAALPVPKFDFYNILPNKEINISEWEAEEQPAQQPLPPDEQGVYILQVGSFKQLEAADQVKAQLALLGVMAEIQRVVINGQDTIYRVRAGPYTETGKLNQERQRLLDNNLEFMLLKLQTDDPRVDKSEG